MRDEQTLVHPSPKFIHFSAAAEGIRRVKGRTENWALSCAKYSPEQFCVQYLQCLHTIIIIDTNNTLTAKVLVLTAVNFGSGLDPHQYYQKKPIFNKERKDNTLKQVNIVARSEEDKGLLFCLLYRVWIVIKSILKHHKIQNKIKKILTIYQILYYLVFLEKDTPGLWSKFQIRTGSKANRIRKVILYKGCGRKSTCLLSHPEQPSSLSEKATFMISLMRKSR